MDKFIPDKHTDIATPRAPVDAKTFSIPNVQMLLNMGRPTCWQVLSNVEYLMWQEGMVMALMMAMSTARCLVLCPHDKWWILRWITKYKLTISLSHPSHIELARSSYIISTNKCTYSPFQGYSCLMSRNNALRRIKIYYSSSCTRDYSLMRLTKTINTYFLTKEVKNINTYFTRYFLFEFESLKCSKLLI